MKRDQFTEEQLNAINAKNARYHNRPGEVANVEQHSSDAKKAAFQVKEDLPRVDIAFTHYRHKLCDPDGHCVKYWIDGIVKAGLLHDDSAKEVRKISHEQFQIDSWEQERTVIELIEAT